MHCFSIYKWLIVLGRYIGAGEATVSPPKKHPSPGGVWYISICWVGSRDGTRVGPCLGCTFMYGSVVAWWRVSGRHSMHVQAHLPVAEPSRVVVPLELVRLSEGESIEAWVLRQHLAQGTRRGSTERHAR